jgi:hypothetical protein
MGVPDVRASCRVRGGGGWATERALEQPPLIPWVRDETTAKRRLRPALRPFLSLARSTHDLIAQSIATLGESKLRPSAEVQARVLVQASHQLRFTEIAECGYTLQALGAAATTYELAAAIGFIGTNNTRAREWSAHSNLAQSYPSTRERKSAVEALLTAMRVDSTNMPKRLAEAERIYQVFCMAKHGNPRLLRKYGATVQDGRLTLYHGPFGGPAIVWLAKFALFHSTRLLVGATITFVRDRANQLDEIANAALGRRALRLLNRLIEAGKSLKGSFPRQFGAA